MAQLPASTRWRDVAGDRVAAFVDAVNAGDAARLVAQFAEDALVNDQLRDFWGREAIEGWVRREIVGERLRIGVLQARSHFGDVILSAEVSGDFDRTGLPDPMVLNLHFSLRDDRIVRLMVLITRPAQADPEVRKGRG